MGSIVLSIEEVQTVTGLGRTKIYEIINAGALPARKLGKRTLVLQADLETFLTGLPSYAAQNGGDNGKQ